MRRSFLTSVLCLISFAGSAHAEPEYEQVGSWIIISEVDPFLESTKVAAVREEGDFFIMFRCWDGKVDFILGHEIDGFDGGNWTDVGVKIGDLKPTFSEWKILDNNNVSANPKPLQFATEVYESNADKLTFRLELDGKIQTPVFDLDGYDIAYQKTIEACGG